MIDTTFDYTNKNIYELKDLSFLRDKLKNTRIVMLGEPDHGAGTAFEIKTHIVKYLYSELGFRVLAFEADFYSTLRNLLQIKSSLY